MSELAAALVEAQLELPTAITRDAEGDGYRYLTLDKLILATRPILSKHGLAVLQFPATIERGDERIPALETILAHVSGERVEQVMPLYLADKTMQGLGSAITYARRYAWQSVLGIAAEEDTDGPAPADRDIPF